VDPGAVGGLTLLQVDALTERSPVDVDADGLLLECRLEAIGGVSRQAPATALEAR